MIVICGGERAITKDLIDTLMQRLLLENGSTLVVIGSDDDTITGASSTGNSLDEYEGTFPLFDVNDYYDIIKSSAEDYYYFDDYSFWEWFDVKTFIAIKEQQIRTSFKRVFISDRSYHRRSNISISGFLAQVGKKKKSGK